MADLTNTDYLLHLCLKYSLRPSKKYGQNYLISPEPIEKMLEAGAVGPNDTVVEVGPGFGVLTFELATHAKKVIAFEIEKKIEEYWEEIKKIKKQKNNIDIVWGNVLTSLRAPTGRRNPKVSQKKPGDSDVAALLAMTPYKVIANLPYQITSPVIRTFLESPNPPELMVLMVQKEVAERICAKPGDMSVLSIAVQYYADAEIVAQVPRDCFWPVPGVDSAVIKIKKIKNQVEPQRNPLAGENNHHLSGIPPHGGEKTTERLFQFVKIGFANRRKLLFKNLLPLVGKKNRGELQKAFDDLGLLPTVRAQELSVEQWKELVSVITRSVATS